jgi:hypothetical protein
MRWDDDQLHQLHQLAAGHDGGGDATVLAPAARGHMATYARAIARSCLSPGVQVVLGPTTAWPHQAIATGHPAPLALDVVDLMLASDCLVVPAERMPSPAARAAASAWETEWLLVAPALLGSEVIAVGLAALPHGVRPDLPTIRDAGERLAAALAAWDSPIAHGAAPGLVPA